VVLFINKKRPIVWEPLLNVLDLLAAGGISVGAGGVEEEG
jgi:hypothetical protein